jgi:hypothetical protein
MSREKFKVGDLVRIRTNKLLTLNFLAVVLKCRHKTDIYYVCPANSPYTTLPYWVEGSMIEGVTYSV